MTNSPLEWDLFGNAFAGDIGAQQVAAAPSSSVVIIEEHVMILPRNETGVLLEVALRDAAGILATGKTSTDLTVKYHRQGAAPTAVSLVAGTPGVWSSGGWVETGDPGVYQFGLPDAALVAAADSVLMTFQCSGCLPVTRTITLFPVNFLDFQISGTGQVTLADASLTATKFQNDAITAPVLSSGAKLEIAQQCRSEIDSNSVQLAAIISDTNQLSADWSEGGRLDAILDARASQGDVTPITAVTDQLATMLELSGVGPDFRYTTDAVSQVSATVPAEVTVGAFTTAAKNELAGLGVSFVQPVWTITGFDKPVVRGDSYLGPLALSVLISGWPGRALSAATQLRLSGVMERGTATFSWTGTYSGTNGNGDDVLTFELTSVDTDLEPGQYLMDVEAIWASPDETVTLAGPGLPLRIVQDQST